MTFLAKINTQYCVVTENEKQDFKTEGVFH